MERTLLLVDDDEDIGASLHRLLRRDGYHILCAHSGQEGLELLARNEVQVIVSDQRMPEMTGVEFLSRAKELYPKTVRIILSGYADLNSVTDAINQGAIYKFLTKPWDNETLCANIFEAFRHYELSEQKSHLALEIQEANTTLASLSLELSKLLAQKEKQIAHISNYDRLTNLPNRWFFLDKLNRYSSEKSNTAQPIAVLLIDLDNFKSINDTMGCEAGDQLLQAVAERLAKYAGENDAIARMGDNEFGLLLSNLKNSKTALDIAQQIMDSFKQVPGLNGVSIGLSNYPTDGLDSNILIKNASLALRCAKIKGNCYHVYSA